MKLLYASIKRYWQWRIYGLSENIYNLAGYKVIFASATEDEGVHKVKELLKGKTTVFAGPSGVGKSSMLNTLTKDYTMETGSVSEK